MVRNVILIGRTGGGKSTLGNVLVNKNGEFESVFKESGRSISKTRVIKEELVEIDIERDGSEKVEYRIIDTIGVGDTKLTPQGVLMRLAEIADRVKKEGLNQILFVTQGRFTKDEIEAYDLLSSIIFDKEVLKYTTVVRTNFPEFYDKDECEEDRRELREENAELAHILGSVNIVYVDNPPMKGLPSALKVAKETREESRKRMFTYLATRRGNYRPSNIDELDERVRDYMTNEEKLHKKMEELEKSRKEQEEKFLKEMKELKEQQAKELKEMKDKADKDIENVRKEGKEELRQAKDELTKKQKEEIDELKRANKEEIRDLKDSHKQDADRIREEGKKNLETLQEQNKRDRERDKELMDDLRKKMDSSSKAVEASAASLKADDSKHEERLLAETKVRMKELEIKEKEVKGEQERLNKLNDAEVAKKNQEKEIARKKAALEQEKASTGILGHIKKKVFTGYDNG
jgi:AIG1 family